MQLPTITELSRATAHPRRDGEPTTSPRHDGEHRVNPSRRAGPGAGTTAGQWRAARGGDGP